jgi:hypothetical protein
MIQLSALIFRIYTVAGWTTGSFTLRDNSDATLLTFVATGSATYYYIQVVFTEGAWKLLDAHTSLN